MKAEQFLEMDDRERDAWIAENIMGWTDVKLEDLGLPYWSEDWDFVGCPPELNGEPDTVYQYSTDYNAMMRVIEKMRGEGYGFSIGDFQEKWAVDIFRGFTYSGRHVDFRLAVYLAAGRAKGVIE
jgi:hypothetical protein